MLLDKVPEQMLRSVINKIH